MFDIKEKPSAAIIVDAYSTGKHLAPAFQQQGIACLHIKSNINLPTKYQHNADNFLVSLTYQDDLDALVGQLNDYDIKFCLPGYESGVALADLLNATLRLPSSNGMTYSQARRDKYVMTDTVARAGVKTVAYFQSNDAKAITQWASNINDKPIVLKPLDSANGDGVHFCDDLAQIEQACEHILAADNQFGQHNKQIFAQSFNAGQEYIINMVSWQNQHYPAEIWRVTRVGTSTIYDKAEIVHPNENEWERLTAYTQQVLAALHIHYGASTTEVKYTTEKGPVLLETSARLMGGSPVQFSKDLAGFSQLSLTVEAYCTPDKFLQRLQQPRPPLTGHGLGVVLIADCSGELQEDLNFEPIKQLPSYHTGIFSGKKGETLKKTIDSLTAPGEVYLKAAQQETLQQDYQSIRQLEAAGLYRNAIATQTEQRPIFSKSYPTQTLFQPTAAKQATLETVGEMTAGIQNIKLIHQ